MELVVRCYRTLENWHLQKEVELLHRRTSTDTPSLLGDLARPVQGPADVLGVHDGVAEHVHRLRHRRRVLRGRLFPQLLQNVGTNGPLASVFITSFLTSWGSNSLFANVAATGDGNGNGTTPTAKPAVTT